MDRLILPALTLAILTLPAATATHWNDCVPSSADPASYLTISAAGRTFYQEERGNPLGTPVPLSGFLLGPDRDDDGLPELLEGEGSWTWEETNGDAGLQRDPPATFFPPFCDPYDPSWGPTDPWPLPCLIVEEDPIRDETCGHDGDTLVL